MVLLVATGVTRLAFTPGAVGLPVFGSSSTNGVVAVGTFGGALLFGSTKVLSSSACSNVAQSQPLGPLWAMSRPTRPSVTGFLPGLGAPSGVLKSVAGVV